MAKILTKISSFNDTQKSLQQLETLFNQLNKNIGITKSIQTSKIVFKDNDTSLMTSAAIANKIESYNYLTSTLSDEQVQDKVGAMFSGNTETLITATYQDADGTIDLAVNNDLSNYDNSSSGFTTTTGTVTSVGGTGTVNGLTLTGTVSSSGNLTLGGTLAINNGDWSGTALADGNIASASTWNGKQDNLTFGISNTNAVKIDAADVADDEYARFTANGLESRTLGEIKSDIGTGNSALVPSAGTAGHFLKHNGTFGQIEYSNINSAPQEFDNDNQGLVPSPGSSGTTTRFLREDGTFQVPAYVADTTYTGGTNLTLAGTTFNVDDAFLKNDADDIMDGALTVNSHILAKTVVYFDAETANTIGSGATGVIDWTVNQKQKVTITGTSITCNFTNPPGPCNLILKVVQGDGSDVIGTWDSDIKWPSGTAPTLSTGNGAIDILSFYWDGTNYYGVASLNFS